MTTAQGVRKQTERKSSQLAGAGFRLFLNSVDSLQLVEKIFAPAVIAAAQHAHDLAAGVQREWPWLAKKNHVIDFGKHAVAFATIAGVTTCDEILPGGVAAA